LKRFVLAFRYRVHLLHFHHFPLNNPQLLPTMVGSRVRISASSCNIGIRDANCWFDSSALVRQFKLDLANPFERAVALLVLYLIASHQTYIIGVSEYFDPDAKSTTNLGKRMSFLRRVFLSSSRRTVEWRHQRRLVADAQDIDTV
jgi:hypothetical protein